MCDCCKFVIEKYNGSLHHNNNTRKYKAGVILHNKSSNKVLLVQSRGNMWGFPKGSFEEGENFKSCAIRETYEETGIQLDLKVLNIEYKITNFVKYYYVETTQEFNDLEIQKHDYNDANGLTWIKLSCLENLLQNDKLKLNYHARSCLYYYFKISKNKF